MLSSSASCKSTQVLATQLPIFASLVDSGSTALAISARAAFALARSPALPTSVTTTVNTANLSLRNCAVMLFGAEFSCDANPLAPSVSPFSLHSMANTTCVCSLAAPAKETKAASSTEHLLPRTFAIASPASRASLPVHKIIVRARPTGGKTSFSSDFDGEPLSCFAFLSSSFLHGGCEQILEIDSQTLSSTGSASSTPTST
mmetsp:Transcript_97042/g.152982  ORF Transcript_97042/g.152982 Transcript_97042/m.152982 type:complete len:202 (-) Transcript_97042:986-1591(-)